MRQKLTALIQTGLILATVPVAATAHTLPADPLGSPLWTLQGERAFGQDRVVFDQTVQLKLPLLAENQHVFPVTVDARALPHVRRIMVLVDLNPLPLPVDFVPGKAAPFLALRIKLDQRTPVRAAAQTDDGVWHLAGAWVDAAGGGCSAPPVSRAKGDWADHLGEVRGKLWHEPDALRLRFSVRHPMDTGLVENIPAYTIDTITVRAGDETLSSLTVTGSVSEDPAFTMLLPQGEARPLTIAMRDTNGREFAGHPQ